MAIYKLQKHSTESSPTSVTKDLGNGNYLSIPFASENTDYQEYLEWAKTNTADPAD